MPRVVHGSLHQASEWSFASGQTYADPANEVDVDVVLTDPQGAEWRVPTYWAGDHEWRVRFSPRSVGRYTYHTVCSDESNPDLHGQVGVFVAGELRTSNPLLVHGPLRVSDDKTYVQHLDGTPFLWLGDTWWFGHARRLTWPDGFQTMVSDRAQKGFSVVQIVAGLSCDMPPFDSRGDNEGGQPWEPDYARLNPAFYDMFDLRVQEMVRLGIVPCILGCWGFYLIEMGLDKMKRHWRNLIARYGAYPVVWCLAGSVDMPYYLSQNRETERPILQKGWAEMARYVHAVDPYGHPVGAHPYPSSPHTCELDEEGLLDLAMAHTGQGGVPGFPRALKSVEGMLTREPRRPAIQGEGIFEGLGGNHQEAQRLYYHALTLRGLRGYNYGANGIWQFNSENDLFGPSPYGATLGNTLWREAYQYPGSAHVGIGKRFFDRFPWWRFEYHPEWVTPHATEDDAYGPYAAGIPEEVRVIYFPRPIAPWTGLPTLTGLEPGMRYRAYFFDPTNGHETPISDDVSGEWQVPQPPVMQDWVVVLERVVSR